MFDHVLVSKRLDKDIDSPGEAHRKESGQKTAQQNAAKQNAKTM
jgi:hypothetical protein